jgi:hypothetical protein
MKSRLVVVTALLCVFSASQNDKAPQDPLHQEITGYEDSGSDISEILFRISEHHKVPIGIKLAGNSYADIVTTLVAQAPDRKWNEMDGVANDMLKQITNNILSN